MRKLIQQLIQMNDHDYDMMLFGMWSRYCESVTITQLEFQKVLCNPAVNAWYLTEMSKLEVKFLEEYASQNSKPSLELIRECYNDITCEIYNYRSLPLLKEAKKCENVGYMLLHGVKVETKIFNQN